MASFSVVSNISASNAQANLGATSVGLQRAITRLSSGYRINQSGDDAAKKDLLPGIASGETIATLAFTEQNGRWDESGIETTATKDMIEGLKKGKTVVIGLYDTAGRILSLPVPLEGFAVAYGGPSVDPKKYVELRQKMIAEYRKQKAEASAASAASTTGSIGEAANTKPAAKK